MQPSVSQRAPSLLVELDEIDAIVCDLIPIGRGDRRALELDDNDDATAEQHAVEPQAAAPEVILEYDVAVVREIRRRQGLPQDFDLPHALGQLGLEQSDARRPLLRAVRARRGAPA